MVSKMVHGKTHTYNKLKCRCELCREANNRFQIATYVSVSVNRTIWTRLLEIGKSEGRSPRAVLMDAVNQYINEQRP